MIRLLTIDEVYALHSKLIARTGGSEGVRDAGMIESALMRASAGFGDVEFYPAIEEKAAAIGCGLTENHGFIDGNKRVGIAAMLLILRINGVKLSYTQRELIDLGLDTAQGDVAVDAYIEWIKRHRAAK